jgi:CheY-like chemotaxis protein
MPLPILEALPLILVAGAAGVGAGWSMATRAARRRAPHDLATPPATALATTTTTVPESDLATTTIVRARSTAGRSAPVADAAPRLAAAPQAHALPGPPANPPTGLAPAADLLVVDDSAVARAKLRRLFEAAGYQVHLANDGVEALALLGKGDYRMLITDLEMPNMDGVTLINTCLGQPHTARMPILAISGHEGLRAKFNACRDICGIHRKPWVDDILLSHVATLVGTRQPRAKTVGLLQEAGHAT